MLSRSALILACLVAAGTPLLARADAVPDAGAKAITTAYQTMCSAALDPTDANLTSAFSSLSPSFVNVDIKGKQTQHDEFVAQAKQQIKQLHVTACDNAIDSETSPDATTIVAVVSGKISGQLQAPDGNHDLDATTKSQDTWKLVNGSWVQTESKEVRALVKIDGKVVQDEGQ